MKRDAVFLLISSLIFAISAFAQVSLPEKRGALLEKSERLNVHSAPEEMQMRLNLLEDPFHWPVLEEPEIVEEIPAGPSDEEILFEISRLIRPGGVLSRGSETLLIVGERRIAVGDYVKINYNGESYKVQLVKADPQAFVLRLNDEQITKRMR